MAGDSRAWTMAEQARLTTLYRAAVAVRDASPRGRYGQPAILDLESIAIALGRSVGAVMGEVTRMGLARRNAQLRSCLGPLCQGQRQFFSDGPGNRMCTRCLDAAELRCA